MPTPHDDLASPEDGTPQLVQETHQVSPNPRNVPPQPAFAPPTDSGEHGAPEPDKVRTPITRYNLGENPKPRIYQHYLMLELSNKPALAKKH